MAGQLHQKRLSGDRSETQMPGETDGAVAQNRATDIKAFAGRFLYAESAEVVPFVSLDFQGTDGSGSTDGTLAEPITGEHKLLVGMAEKDIDCETYPRTASRYGP